MPRAIRSRARDEEASTVAPEVAPYLLRLYVAGSTPNSTQAIRIVRNLCASFPRGDCKYEVVDLHLTPGLARRDNVVGVPCLVKVQPAPRTVFIGITSNLNRMILKLGLPVRRNDRRATKRH
jgi:circadian clock protein KaiB